MGAPHSSTPQAEVAGTATTAPPAPDPFMGPASSSPFADAVVNTSLAITQASISGMPSTPECLFSSPSLAIEVRVSEKIRGKIWNNEYFDLSLLLTNPVVEDRYQLTVKGAEGNMTAPGICLEPVAKPKKVLTLETWFSCFHIFVGIYCKKYPTEAPALMKYGEVVQDLAARGHNWKFYDENFRFLRQSQPASFPWGVIHWELWMRSQTSVLRKMPLQPPSSRARSDTPLGYCFRFSKGAECSGCQYKHLCYKCERSHPPTSCLFVPVVKPQKPMLRLPNPQSPGRSQNELPTPVMVDRLSFFLSGYTPSIAEHLVSGFTFGFSIHHEGQRISSHSQNLMSALHNPDMVDVKIEKELLAGRLSGPFEMPPLSPFRVSPLGVIPKKTPGEFRLIHHLSYPRGSSVNDGISPEFSSVRYATITDAIRHIRAAGTGCFLSKTDIKNALRIIPVHPSDYNLLGMQRRGQYYFDKCMPMGCSSSCRTFELFSSALEWVAQNKLHINHIVFSFLPTTRPWSM